MSDRRFLASNGRVALASLEGKVEAERFSDGTLRQLVANAWLREAPGGARDRQLLWGDPFRVLDERDGASFGISEKDGYVGYVATDALGSPREATHRISVRTTWAWGKPNFKTDPLIDLHMNSPVRIVASGSHWVEIETDGGSVFAPENHCRALAQPDVDNVTAAHFFVGTPYVWAGNTGFGIDCSGLVQAAFHAIGRACPPDSDLQEQMPGQHLDEDAPLQRGDLIFWKRHVALMIDADRILHANAHHMAVAVEPLQTAITRIAATDTGPVTSRLRPA